MVFNRFARILLAIMFLSPMVIAQLDECNSNPRGTPCREHAASKIQDGLKTHFPDMRVRASGDVVVFSDPKQFEKQQGRASYYKSVQEQMGEDLCLFFSKVRIESSAPPATL